MTLSTDRVDVLLHLERAPPGRASPLLDADRRRRVDADHVDDRIERRRGVARTMARSPSSTRTATRRRKSTSAPNRQDAAAAKQVTTTPTEEWRSFKWVDPASADVQGARRRGGARPALHAGDARRPAPPAAARRRVRPRRRLRAERSQVLVQLLPRVHVPQPAREPRLRRARRRLPGQLRLRAGLADGHLPSHGRQGPGRHRGRLRSTWSPRTRSIRSASASTAEATAASSR